MKLIPNAGQAWRMWSVRMASLLVVWGVLPPDQQAAIVQWLGVPSERVSAVLGLLVILARVVRQDSVSTESKQ